MDKYTKIIVTQASLSQRFLSSYFRGRLPAWKAERRFDQNLLVLAGVCLAISFTMLLINGLETFFWPVHNLGNTLLPAFAWENITFVGDTYTALAIALLFSYRFPQLAMAILISAIAGTVMIHGFKHLFDSPRPPLLLLDQGLEVIGPVYKRNSMPSGHTATAFILATLLTRCVKFQWKKIAIIAAAFMVAWSRVACGVHWPADVFAGAALGMAAGVIGLRLADVIPLKINTYLFVSILLAFSAISLFEYDGGFDHTATTANILAFSSLFYFSASWLFEFAKPALKQIMEW